jgi:pyrroline-5-carboxylate reductase
MKKISIIGNGNMAKAIIYGIIKDIEIEVVGRDINKLERLREELEGKISISQIHDGFSIDGKNIILAVKPQNLDNLSKMLRGRARHLFSVLAGTNLNKIKTNISADGYIRAMPNLSAIYGASMTALYGDEVAMGEAIFLFNKIGHIIELQNENEIDIATAITGSGPAFLALIAEAMADGGVKNGLKRTDSEKLVKGLFFGFSKLIENNSSFEIKNLVMSPAGTTAYGYSRLESHGVRASFIETIDESVKRAKELSNLT